MEIRRKNVATLYPWKSLTVGMELHYCSLDGVEGELRDVYTTKLKASHYYIKKVEDELHWWKNPSMVFIPLYKATKLCLSFSGPNIVNVVETTMEDQAFV